MSIIEKALEKARREAIRQPSTPECAHAAPETESENTFLVAVLVPAADDHCESRGSGAGTASVVKINPSPELIMAHADDVDEGGGYRSKGSEYRLLKEHLLALRKDQPSMSLFMVTSPMRNEGKTVVSCNLAATLAREYDHTVLLVDADLRNPTCHHMLGIPRPTGLSDYLLHGASFNDVVIRTGLGRLSVIGAGRPITNPAELFTSNRMRDFLREIKFRYPDRIIIVDTGPLLPFAETRALSRAVDGVLLVSRENVTVKVHLEAALRALEGCPLLGVVYNDASNFGVEKEVFELPLTY